MNRQDLKKLLQTLRTRWLTVFLITFAATLGAIALTLLTTPVYQASTRLFVATTGNSTVNEAYQGNRLSMDRVRSYTELLMGESLAQRTLDKLGLDMSAKSLQQKVTATAKRDTVLIDVVVRDQSPVRARDLANAMSDEFVVLVRELETPRPGAPPDARVIVEQRANIPTKPVVPKPTRNILGGIALGLLAGVVVAFARDMLDDTVKDRATIEELAGVGLVGSIPVDKEVLKTPAIAFDKNNSSIAEAFRKLRTNLQFLAVDNPPRVIVIASSGPNEGKTTTAINIALALAEAEYNVVLVDGDMRRPSLATALDLVGVVGFSTVLSGAATLSEALQETKYQRLTVLTAGAVPPNPSELLGSMAAKRVLSELRAQFDYVIVDSAPLRAVTDAAVLVANSDGALLIARYGRTKRDQLGQAVGSLQHVGASVLGSVITVMPSRRDRYSKYGYYGYYGYYGTQSGEQEQEQVRVEPDRDSLPEISEKQPSETGDSKI